ncbi:hypothetical protein PsaNZ63_28790 [Pseudomonas syringae pv. actinidiae]|nr:hypothetical protein PsaNZ63_28790 [Pseudomonas syringae pv. actinidiae]
MKREGRSVGRLAVRSRTHYSRGVRNRALNGHEAVAICKPAERPDQAPLTVVVRMGSQPFDRLAWGGFSRQRIAVDAVATIVVPAEQTRVLRLAAILHRT